MSYIIETLQQMMLPINLLVVFLSVLFGLLVGMLPGLTSTMAVALITGLTFGVPLEAAMLSLIGVYVGAISGGNQPAVLLRIPGTPAQAATAAEGYAIAQRGEGGLGIFLAVFASFIGTVFSAICVMIFTPLLSDAALKFGSWEFFMLALFGVMICGSITAGGDSLKGWISGFLGLFVAQIGLDTMNAYPRFAFDIVNLLGGIALIPVMIGLFGFPEVVEALKDRTVKALKVTKFKVSQGLSIVRKNSSDVGRSSVIGTLVGIIPGVGEDIGAWLSYWAAKTRSKNKEKFGKGAYEGVLAAEAGNNSAIGGSLIPVLSLAIPGSASAAVLLAAMWLHGLQPGPRMMSQSPGFVYQIGTYLIVSSLVMLILALLISKVSVRVLQVDKRVLMPIIFVFCVVGAFVISNRMFDVYVMFVFGIVGLFLKKMDYPPAPFLLGLILGPMADSNLRRALSLTDGSLEPFFTRPISLVLVIAVSVLIFAQLNIFKKVKSHLVNSNNKEMNQ